MEEEKIQEIVNEAVAKKLEELNQKVEAQTVIKHHFQEQEVRVRSTTPTEGLGGSIAKFVLDGKLPVLVPIALPALNQAIKGAAKSKQYLAPMGIHLLWEPCFTTRRVRKGESDTDVTAIKLKAVVFKY